MGFVFKKTAQAQVYVRAWLYRDMGNRSAHMFSCACVWRLEVMSGVIGNTADLTF